MLSDIQHNLICNVDNKLDLNTFKLAQNTIVYWILFYSKDIIFPIALNEKILQQILVYSRNLLLKKYGFDKHLFQSQHSTAIFLENISNCDLSTAI